MLVLRFRAFEVSFIFVFFCCASCARKCGCNRRHHTRPSAEFGFKVFVRGSRPVPAAMAKARVHQSGRYQPGARAGKWDGRLTAAQARALTAELAKVRAELTKARETAAQEAESAGKKVQGLKIELQGAKTRIARLEAQLRAEINLRMEREADDGRPHIRRAWEKRLAR